MSKTLTKQLKNLNEIKPSAEWQAQSRSVLLSQINHGTVAKDAHWFSFVESAYMQRFWIQATRPIALAVGVFLFFIGSSIVSLRAADQAKPGDNLYIAKLISERAQFAMTFDNTKKAKLNLDFATKRADELTEVAKTNAIGNEAQVQELTSNLQTELAEAKSRITSIIAARPQATPKAESIKSAEPAKTAKAPATVKNSAILKSANLGKSNEAVDYYDPLQVVLEAAKESVDNKDYAKAAETLKALSAAIDEPSKLDVKATTTNKESIKVEALQKATSAPK